MKDSKNKANFLINESSPYLQQHAYNPVEWHPWGEEALNKAKEEDKPILVSIGYSTCHWCHVMERESFENEEVAAFMNEHFVNIKVDREERPDIDAIYMEAVQLIQNGQGGWPLNCFLMPDKRPFFGGTYFPPQAAYQRASWIDVLHNLNNAFRNKRDEVEAQSNKILHYIQKSQNHFTTDLNTGDSKVAFDCETTKTTYNGLASLFDTENGGFGGAPKFPGSMALRFCLNYYMAEKDETALNHLLLSLDKMVNGGIFDHLGGGFARYTVDEKWLVPHFEKMLYDNALLVGLLADAYKLTNKPLYKQRITEIFKWVEREMLSEEGGFYSALDADSEGVEGKFYVWDKDEIEAVFGDDEMWGRPVSELFCAYYDVSTKGNWEEKNILNLPVATEGVICSCNLELVDETTFEELMTTCRDKLLTVRAQRIRPGLDDKILLDWNAMMITAYCKAYQALGDESYKNTAKRAIKFVLKKFSVEEGALHLYHAYKDGLAKHPAFLDDYALLIEALFEMFVITQDNEYSELAKAYTDFVNNEFLDYKDNLYYFTSAKQQDILLHKKSFYDNATPSGNSTMVHNLQRTGILFDEASYREQAQKTLNVVRKSIEKYPQSFAKWGSALFAEIYPIRTIRISGKNQSSAVNELLTQALFNTFVIKEENKASENQNNEKNSFVVCKDFTCSLPVFSVEEALKLL